MDKQKPGPTTRSKSEDPIQHTTVSDNLEGNQANPPIHIPLIATTSTMLPPGGKSETNKKTTEELLASLATSLDTMQTSIDSLLVKADANKASIDELKVSTTKSSDELNTKVDDLLQRDKEMRKDVTKVKNDVKKLDGEIRILIDEKEKRDQEKRNLNIIIRGTPEKKADEKMHETMNWLITELGCTFPYSLTNGSYRISQKQKPKEKRKTPPRNIVLRLISTQQKSEIFGLAKNLRDHDILSNVRFANDYTDEQMLTYREVQRIYSVASKMEGVSSNVRFANDYTDKQMLTYREVQRIYSVASKMEGVSTRMKGLSIVIDGKIYSKKDFDSLPHGLSLENVSTIETPDGMAFQGHNSPASNFHRCNITDSAGRSGTSVDHIYCIRMSQESRADLALQTMIKKQENPYVLKRLSKLIHITEEWKGMCHKVLEEYMGLKLTQNPAIRDKLINYSKRKFYEATRDPVYGAGFVLGQAAEIHANNPNLGPNKTGVILTFLEAQMNCKPVAFVPAIHAR